jgi:hypothetical protein
MYVVWLAALALGAGFAIFGAKNLQGKLLNLAIIVGCMALGFGIGYAVGLGSANLGSVPGEALPVAIMFGVVAALGCVQLNSSRAK